MSIKFELMYYCKIKKKMFKLTNPLDMYFENYSFHYIHLHHTPGKCSGIICIATEKGVLVVQSTEWNTAINN